VMGSVDVFRAAIVGFLGLAVLLDFASLLLLYAVFFMLGTAETLFDNASVAILPAVVERGDLEKANGRLFASQIVAGEFVGPPLGAFLFAAAAALPFLLDAGTFAAAAALVLALRGRFRAGRPEGVAATTLVQDIGEGLGWLARHRLLLTLAFVLALAGFAVEGVFVILVLYAQEVLNASDYEYGVLMAAFAAGGILGSLIADRIGRLLGTGLTISAIFLLEAAAFAGLALTSNFIFAFAMIALDALAGTVWNVVTLSLRQELIPERLLGRVGSAFRMIGLGGMSLGVLVSGLLARELGLAAPYWFAAAIMTVLSITCAAAVNNRRVSEARTAAKDT